MGQTVSLIEVKDIMAVSAAAKDSMLVFTDDDEEDEEEGEPDLPKCFVLLPNIFQRQSRPWISANTCHISVEEGERKEEDDDDVCPEHDSEDAPRNVGPLHLSTLVDSSNPQQKASKTAANADSPPACLLKKSPFDEHSTRIVDVYQTDCTLIQDHEGEDWTPLLVGNETFQHKIRMQLPFRRCSSSRCFHCRRISMSGRSFTSMPLPDKKQDHRRQPSDDLHGLWIPVESTTQDENRSNDRMNSVGCVSRKWMKKSQSERRFKSCTQDGPRKENGVFPLQEDELKPPVARTLQPRCRAFSDSLVLEHLCPQHAYEQYSKISLQGSSEASSMEMAGIEWAAPLRSTSSALSRASSRSSSVASSVRRRLSAKPGEVAEKREDSIYQDSSGSWKGAPQILSQDPIQPQEVETIGICCESPDDQAKQSQTFHRRRIRSEDVIDRRADSIPSELPIELVVEPPTCDDMTICSMSRTSCSRLAGLGSTARPMSSTSSALNESPWKRRTEKRLHANSPKSVLAFDALDGFALEELQSLPEPSAWDDIDHAYQIEVFKLRREIERLKANRSLKCVGIEMRMIELYHSISCLHLQHEQTNKALCVIDHALERFYETQEFPSPRSKRNLPCMTLQNVLAFPADTSAKTSLARLLNTKCRILLCLPTRVASYSEQDAKHLAHASISLLRFTPTGDSPDVVLLLAQSELLLGRACSRNEDSRDRRQGLTHFQQSLCLLRRLAALQPRREVVICLAETLLRMGDLLLSQGLIGSAKSSYWEALGLFRVWVRVGSNYKNTEEVSNVADMALTLGHLGWIHLQENDSVLAQISTAEGLSLLRPLIDDHEMTASQKLPAMKVRIIRILASLEYQLGMVSSRDGQFANAMSCWKAALWHQQTALHCDHVDISITLEAIGSLQHQHGDAKQALISLENALQIQKKSCGNPLDAARIQSRLSLVYIELGDLDRAKRFLSKSLRRYETFNVPVDELGLQAQEWLSVRRQG